MSDSWTQIGAIATALSAFSTLVVAWLTWQYVAATKNMVEEMKNTRQQSFRPHVSVGLEVERGRNLYILIQNTGNVTGRDVQFTFDGRLADASGTLLSSLINTIPTMIPGLKYQTLLGSTVKLKEDPVRKYIVQVKYKDYLENEYCESYVLDIEPYINRKWVEYNN